MQTSGRLLSSLITHERMCSGRTFLLTVMILWGGVALFALSRTASTPDVPELFSIITSTCVLLLNTLFKPESSFLHSIHSVRKTKWDTQLLFQAVRSIRPSGSKSATGNRGGLPLSTPCFFSALLSSDGMVDCCLCCCCWLMQNGAVLYFSKKKVFVYKANEFHRSLLGSTIVYIFLLPFRN